MVPPQQPRLLGVDSSGFDKKYPSLDFPKTYPVPWTSENVPGFQDFSKTLSSSLCPAFGTGRDLGIRGRLSKVTTFGSLGSQIKYNLDMIYNPRSNIIYRLYIYRSNICGYVSYLLLMETKYIRYIKDMADIADIALWIPLVT